MKTKGWQRKNMDKDMIADIFKEAGFNHEIKSFSCDEYGQVDAEIKCNVSSFSEINNLHKIYK